MSGFALAQTAESPSAVFDLCVVEDTSFKDVEVSVALKADTGEKDQGGGVVWRYPDANNYYVARMNPLEDNFRVYKVVGGKRSPEFQDAEVKVPAGGEHAPGPHGRRPHRCFLNGKKHLNVKDGTFAGAGKVGLWTKTDARSSFDLFEVKPAGK